MGKRVVTLLLLAMIVAGGYYAYKKHNETTEMGSGDVTCQGCLTPEQKTRFDKENLGETADGQNERKTNAARVAAEQATSGQVTSGQTALAAGATGPSSMTAPGASIPTQATPERPVVVPGTGAPMNTQDLDGRHGSRMDATMGTPPAGDSVSPNPTNGMTFAGKGSYQWYRQGNLTWRVDTTSGRSCIVYATMEEWQKQIVVNHGCGRST